MGWDGVYGKFPGSKKFIETEAKFTEYDVIAHARKGNQLWAVIQHKTSGERSAILFLLRRYANEYDYKAMDEGMHPYYYDIPERLFKMLTPTTNKYALAWRAELSRDFSRTRTIRLNRWGKVYCLKSTVPCIWSLVERMGRLFSFRTPQESTGDFPLQDSARMH